MPTHYTNITIKELEKIIPKYLKHCTIERGLSPVTVSNKRYVFGRLLNFRRSGSFSSRRICSFTEHLYNKGWSNNSIGTELKVIKAFVNYLEMKNYIENSWVKEISLPKTKRNAKNITTADLAEEVILAGSTPGEHDHHLHRKSKEEHRQALRFILRTGLRLTELLKLKPADINYENRTYFVNSKGGNIDVLPLPEDMTSELIKRTNNRYLFRVCPNRLNITLKRGSFKLNVKPHITVHSLRHTFCSSLLRNGAPLQLTSRLMRHSSVEITDKIYSHFVTDDLVFALNKHPLLNKKN